MFTRYPEAGKTKTRLIPELGPSRAAVLQRRMTEHILANLQAWQGHAANALEIHFTGGTLDQMQFWLGPHRTYQSQAEGVLGQRLHQAFCHGLGHQFERMVIIGADCPSITSQHLDLAFQQLTGCDLVLGPAHDGGYYLVGLSRPCAALFEDISWGTSQVFAETMAIATRHQLSLATLSPLHDIDRPEDLASLPQPLAQL